MATKERQMKEIRLHGRGGQGAVTAAAILCNAFITEGKYASSFAMFGAEPRGAPVAAFARFDSQSIRQKTQVYYPDCLVILDPAQAKLPDSYSGLRPNGILVLNSPQPLEGIPDKNLTVIGVVDADSIALEEIGVPIANSCIMGAFAATTGWVNLDSVVAALGQFFEGERLKKNIRAAERGFKEVTVTRW